MMHFDINDFELVKFYSYTSVIPANSALVDVREDDERQKHVVEKLRTFYMELRKEAANISDHNEWKFTDNKTVFKLRRKDNNAVIYVGYKDGRLTVGLSVYLLFGHIYDFETKTWSDYLTQVSE